MDRLDVMQLFARIAETGSFSKGARAVGVGQPTASKQIAALEERLGAQLVLRTSRGLKLTEAGQTFYEASIRMLDELEAAESGIGRGRSQPSGLIRVALSAGFGRMYVVPRLPEFFALYPNVAIDLDVSERHVNLVEDGVDVAVRIGFLSDSSLIARRIGAMDTATVASPAYFEAFGEPRTPGNLEHHASVVFVFRGGPRPWTFKGPSGPIVVHPKARVRSNDAEHLRAAVKAGLGIAHSASWLFASDLQTGAVRQVLADFMPDRSPIHAVFSPGRTTPMRVKVFIDFLAKIFAEEPTLRIR